MPSMCLAVPRFGFAPPALMPAGLLQQHPDPPAWLTRSDPDMVYLDRFYISFVPCFLLSNILYISILLLYLYTQK